MPLPQMISGQGGTIILHEIR